MNLLILFVTVATYIAYSAYRLFSNYRKAKQIKGLPTLVTPFSYLNPLCLFLIPIIGKFLRKLDKAIPQSLRFGYRFYNLVDGSYYASQHHDRAALHETKYGPAYVNVSPAGNTVVIVDPEAIKELHTSWKRFGRQLELFELLSLYGPSMFTTSGITYQRHRRITQPPFNESNSKLVWSETLKHARRIFVDNSNNNVGLSSKEGTKNAAAMALDLTFSVLMSAGLGINNRHVGAELLEKDGTGRLNSVEHIPGFRHSFFSASRTVLDTTLTALALPSWMQTVEIRAGVRELKIYLERLISQEKENQREHGPGTSRPTLVNALVRYSEEEKKLGQTSLDKYEEADTELGLSDLAIMGNLFAYNMAGHDTTASVIITMIYILSVFPEIQSWIREEILSVLPQSNDESCWPYEAFSKLNKCQAVMYETLRLYTPATSPGRITSSLETLQIATSFDDMGPAAERHTVQLPPKTVILGSLAGCWVCSSLWGKDALEFKPSRFLGGEGQVNVPKHFFPWAVGYRSCPGKRFSQVELVAWMARTFRNHRVELVKLRGESNGDTFARVMECVENREVMTSMRMTNPEVVELRLVEV